MDGLYRFAEFNDGVTTRRINVEEGLNLSCQLEYIGGFSTIRTLNGGAVKTTNWVKKKITITASGGYGHTLGDLDYTRTIEVSWGAPETTVVSSLSATLPAHRTDLGYTPVYYVLTNGRRVRYNGSNAASSYIVEYFPVYTAHFSPPSSSKAEDNALGHTFTIVGEEV